MKYYLNLTFLFFLSFSMVYFSYLAAKKYPIFGNNIKISKKFIFKTKYINKNKKITRTEIEIYDNTEKNFYNILNIKLNGKSIELIKAPASGFRARKYFQLPSGKYILTWTISTSDYQWPRTKTYKKVIEITDQKFIHIKIVGKNIDITYDK